MYLMRGLLVYWNTPLDQWSGGSNQKVNEAVGLSPEKRNLLLLPAAWGLCPHHQTKLPNMGPAFLPPAEAKDMESNQPQPRTQNSQPDQSQPFIFFSFKQLFSELISESFTILISSFKS